MKDEVQGLRQDNKKIKKSLEEKQIPERPGKTGKESSKEHEWPCLGRDWPLAHILGSFSQTNYEVELGVPWPQLVCPVSWKYTILNEYLCLLYLGWYLC